MPPPLQIVRCVDFQAGHDGQVYLVMPLAVGGTVQGLLEATRACDCGSGATVRGLDEGMARHLFRQLVQALLYSHSKGVAHMDIKPAVRCGCVQMCTDVYRCVQMCTDV